MAASESEIRGNILLSDGRNLSSPKLEGRSNYSQNVVTGMKFNSTVSKTSSCIEQDKPIFGIWDRSDIMDDILTNYQDLRTQVGDIEHSLVANLLADNELLHQCIERKNEEIKRERRIRAFAEEEMKKYMKEGHIMFSQHPDNDEPSRVRRSLGNTKQDSEERRRSEEDRRNKLEEELEQLLTEHEFLLKEKEVMTFAKDQPKDNVNNKTKTVQKEVPEVTRRLYSQPTSSVLPPVAAVNKQSLSARRTNRLLPPIKASLSNSASAEVSRNNRSSRQTRSNVVLPAIGNKMLNKIWRW